MNRLVLFFVADMSEVFEGYERQYCELSANLSRKCNSAALLDGGIAVYACLLFSNNLTRFHQFFSLLCVSMIVLSNISESK